MKIITISGLDGSGKSTQIEMLRNCLEGQDQKVFYFHAVQYGIVRKIINFRNKYCLICRLTGKCQIKNNEEKSVTKANWLQIQLRKLALGIDLCRFSGLLKKLEKEKYDYLVSDRFFYDSAINIEYLSNKRYAPFPIVTPHFSIYLQTSPEAIIQRERIPDQGLAYLKKKKELYDAKKSIWNWKVIDGARDKNIIFEEIKRMLP